MFSLIEAMNFRCLRYVRQPLGSFHVLVGPNASGKTTFLDVVAFLRRLVADGLDAAVTERTQNFVDLVWGREGTGFQIAVEARIPKACHQRLAEQHQCCDTIRYEVEVKQNPQTGETSIAQEQGFLKQSATRQQAEHKSAQSTLFPRSVTPPESLFVRSHAWDPRRLFRKGPGGDSFYPEAYATKGKCTVSFKLGPGKSALGSLPADETTFPVSTWFKQLLSEGIEAITLNSRELRKASRPGQKTTFKPDGSNLPWVVAGLRERYPERLRQWIDHVRTALPDLVDVRTVVREDDRHRYLVLVYAGGLEIPSWVASDGTLRLLALTLPAYLDDFKGVYLIEEPENGIHPRAIETMYHSLSSVYDGQVLLATHSPVILSIVDPRQVLCFAKTDEGATDIVVGSDHPALRDWQGQENLGVYFAGGVLG
jgi:predicted ATPase